ncbi:unnamed protein product [Camellia sinensis]
MTRGKRRGRRRGEERRRLKLFLTLNSAAFPTSSILSITLLPVANLIFSSFFISSNNEIFRYDILNKSKNMNGSDYQNWASKWARRLCKEGMKDRNEGEDPNSLKYAKLVSPHDKLSSLVKDLVQGIIEGETRVLAASMTMEEIFRGTKEFKQEVFEKVQLELNQFGLLIYNANVKQLVDVPGHEYFSYLGQKTQMEAANQEKIDVAEAKMKGDIGAKLREGQTLQNVAKIDLDTKIISTQRQGKGKKQEIRVKTEVRVFENLREAEVAEANAELAKRKAGWAREAQVAEVEAMKAVALRDAELQWEVEIMNGLTRTEKLKAEFLSKATVEHQIKVRRNQEEDGGERRGGGGRRRRRRRRRRTGGGPNNRGGGGRAGGGTAAGAGAGAAAAASWRRGDDGGPELRRRRDGSK